MLRKAIPGELEQAMTTLYDTLGVPMHATDDEIKRAYRKAAMKWHPDRNSGAEEGARATFQEIKDAYAILSDAAQRKVYDAVYAEQMRGWEAQRTRHQRAAAEREAAARAADEAVYAEMVALAMRFADDGHNRDVLFGVLLGRRCEARRAAQIADSVAALQAARCEAEKAKAAAQTAAAPAASDLNDLNDAAPVNGDAASRGTGHHAAPEKRDENAHDSNPAGVLGGLWYQFLSGLRL
jgi:curved DNA-binding protein CbpA